MPSTYGESFSPQYEVDVVIRFVNMAAWRYGFRILEIRTHKSPDIIAERGGRKYGVEVELKSSGFRYHVRKGQRADVVVCWEHDWPDCPVDEVIELKSEPLGGEFSTDEEDFYRYAATLLDARRSVSLLFCASTPILLLRTEVYSSNRQNYRDRLFRSMSTKSKRLRGQYLFGYRKTMRIARNEDPGKLQLGLDEAAHVLHSEKIMASGYTTLFPSCILGDRGGAELLKDPITGDVAAVEFFGGPALEIRRRLFERAWLDAVPRSVWQPEILAIAS